MKATIKGVNFTAELEGDPLDIGMTIGFIAGQNQERGELNKEPPAEPAIPDAAPPPPTPPPLRIVSESGKQWSDEKIALLKSEKAKGSSDKVIGKMLGKSAGAVSVKACQLRKEGQVGKSTVPRRGKLSNWTKEQEARFRVGAPHKTVPELCRMFNCSEKEVNKRLVVLKNEG